MNRIKQLFGMVPKGLKLDTIVDSVTTNAKQRKFAKIAVRIIQIGVSVYLLQKGLIDDESAINIIKGE